MQNSIDKKGRFCKESQFIKSKRERMSIAAKCTCQQRIYWCDGMPEQCHNKPLLPEFHLKELPMKQTIPQDILKEAEAYANNCLNVTTTTWEWIVDAYAAGAMAERQKLQQAVKPSTHVTP
jgi:hypothetical protein